MKIKTGLKWVQETQSYGITGLKLNLNMQQCIALSNFGALIKSHQDTINYPEQINDFFEVFSNFAVLDNPYLFKDEVIEDSVCTSA